MLEDNDELKMYRRPSHQYVPRPFKCHTCGFMTPDERVIRRHVQSHQSGMYPCKKCGEAFESSEARVAHLKEVHPTMIKCSKCGDMVPQPKLTQHLKDFHPKFVTCDFCGRDIPVQDIKEHQQKAHTAPMPETRFEVISDDSDMEEDEEGSDIEFEEGELTEKKFIESVRLYLATGMGKYADNRRAAINIRKLAKRYLREL